MSFMLVSRHRLLHRAGHKHEEEEEEGPQLRLRSSSILFAASTSNAWGWDTLFCNQNPRKINVAALYD